MLERATACLKSGAARDSLRCTSQASRSKRMLHSSFWNHGAGALDLPPWAVSMFSMPSDLPLQDGDKSLVGAKSQARMQSQPTTDGVFLDFLYPPQALAWLRRASTQQHLQTWERRNTRRLPEGFVVASRGYSSRRYRQGNDIENSDVREADERLVAEAPYQPSGTAVQALKESDKFLKGDIGFPEQKELVAGSEEQAHRTEGQAHDLTNDAFAISPGDLAETTPNPIASLRNLLMFNRGRRITQSPETSRRMTERAWSIYRSLDYDTRSDSRLKRELLEWLVQQRNEIATSRSEELYQSIPTGEKTTEIYNAMLSLYLASSNVASASNLHHECLQTLENGYTISRTLFQHAVEQSKWDLAIQTAAQHHSRYIELRQTNQIKLFWLHVSEIPNLTEKAIQLLRHFKGRAGLKSADLDTRVFCLRFFKEAISQFSIVVRGQTDKNWQDIFKDAPVRDQFASLFRYVAETDVNSANLLQDALYAFLNLDTNEYLEYHLFASIIYWEYRKIQGVQPSEHLLEKFLWTLSFYEPNRNTNEGSTKSVTLQDIVSDWKFLHRRLSKKAYHRLVRSSAWAGRIEQFEAWMLDFRTAYPKYDDWKESLWTMVYLYARRTNLDGAQQAFAEVKRITAEYGDEPDVKCWSVLLHAHGRVGDLEGAFTNFQNMLQSKQKPNEACFGPIFAMLASRGDVEGLEDLIEQFDDIVGDKHSADMVAYLINAHISQGTMQEAESVLRRAIPKIRAGDITGHMTNCFNAVMRGYAFRYDFNATMGVYRWMRQEEIKLNGDTFAAILLVLSNFRRTNDASKILRVDMREHGIPPTAFHYAIVIRQLVVNTDYANAVYLYDDMIAKNIRPSAVCNTLYLRAKTMLENRDTLAQESKDGDLSPLDASIKELEVMLERYDGEETAARQWTSLIGLDDTSVADPAPYFETLIFVHGKRKCFEAVKSLFAKYKEVAKDRGLDENTLPLGLISKLMSAHWHAGEYDQVEEYWRFAKERADEDAARIPVPSFRSYVSEKSLQSADPLTLRPLPEPYPNPEPDHAERSEEDLPTESKQTLLTDKDTEMTIRPVPRRRHILNQPLRWYLAALSSQSRVIDAITLVSRLLTQGYTMDNHTWNLFICFLLDTTPPLALVAFALTERFLTPGFPGWVHEYKTRYPEKRRARLEGLEYMNARYIGPGRLMPTYKTLVRLGAALLDIRRVESQGRRGVRTDVPPELQRFVGTTREIRKLAAKTLHVVQSIPYIVGDKTQAKYLRRERD